MLKKLEHDALAADLVAVENLLSSHTEDEDPVGYFQFSARKAAIEDKLRRLTYRADRHAELGVFFGGGPVQGSRGINADFAGKALDQLQALISKRYSDSEGRLKQSGRLPQVNQSKMLVTNVVRGSVGFVLEEAGDTGEIVNTPLKEIVDEVSDILSRVGAADEAIFDEAAATLDQRVLGSLRDFFVLLDDQKATLRVVNGDRDFMLDRPTVSLARTRVQEIEIEEVGQELIGTLFVLPASKRFDFVTEIGGTRMTLSGAVSHEAAAQIAGQGELAGASIDAREIARQPVQVEIQTREIRELNRAPRKVYRLLRVIGTARAISG
jgi:hypothetical protein